MVGIFSRHILVSSLVHPYLLLLLLPDMLPRVMGEPERHRKQWSREFSVRYLTTYSANVCQFLNLCIFTQFHTSQKSPQVSVQTFILQIRWFIFQNVGISITFFWCEAPKRAEKQEDAKPAGEIVRRSAEEFSAGWPCRVCFGVTGRLVHVCSLTRPHLACFTRL